MNDTLRASKLFRLMSDEVDEDEHSMELHYPYIRKVFGERDISVIPILVGQLSAVKAAQFAEVLAAHVADRVAFMERGELVAADTPSAILHQPQDSRIQSFLRTYHERNSF